MKNLLQNGRRFGGVILLATLVLCLWTLPRWWYSKTDKDAGHYWLAENTSVQGWTYREVPVTESAERVLVADILINGSFSHENGREIRVFSAKRYEEKERHIGLFVHTPDRCWTETGWRMEWTEPEYVAMDIHGVKITFERRIFTIGAQRELVYFGGLVAGQALPYRLDHNLSVGMRSSEQKSLPGRFAARAGDAQFWSHVADSFVHRRPLIGPKQFVRISTPIIDEDIGPADAFLQEFLPQWLRLSDYQEELRGWKSEK